PCRGHTSKPKAASCHSSPGIGKVRHEPCTIRPGRRPVVAVQAKKAYTVSEEKPMVDDTRNNDQNEEQDAGIARRDFVALSVGAGLTAGSLSAADLKVVESNVEIKTPDGTCDAAFIHPASGSHPGVLIWTDAFGLRPSFREMAKRLAAQGYSVLVPNPFYRVAKSPVFEDASK